MYSTKHLLRIFWNESNASASVSESGHRAPGLGRRVSTTAVSDSAFGLSCAHRSTKISRAAAVAIWSSSATAAILACILRLCRSDNFKYWIFPRGFTIAVVYSSLIIACRLSESCCSRTVLEFAKIERLALILTKFDIRSSTVHLFKHIWNWFATKNEVAIVGISALRITSWLSNCNIAYDHRTENTGF